MRQRIFRAWLWLWAMFCTVTAAIYIVRDKDIIGAIWALYAGAALAALLTLHDLRKADRT